MKKLSYLAVAAALPLFFACSRPQSNQDHETEADEAPAAEAPAEPEEEVAEPFTVKEYEKKVGENELEIDFPTSGSPELIAAIGSWINSSLTGTYRGKPDNGEALFRHYAVALGQDEDLNEFGGYAVDKFELGFTSSRVVTYDYTSYTYEGGAHGMGGTYGTTFLRSDGRIFSRSCITSYKALHNLFVEGLKKTFKAKSDSELLANLLNVSSIAKLPAPALDPWIEEEGVVFSYTPYEIAPYSAGSPRVVIPFAKILPYLTEEGKLFITPQEADESK